MEEKIIAVRNERGDAVPGVSAPINPDRHLGIMAHVMGAADDITSASRLSKNDVRDADAYGGYQTSLSQTMYYSLLQTDRCHDLHRLSVQTLSVDNKTVFDISSKEKAEQYLKGRAIARAVKSREVCIVGGYKSIMLVDEKTWKTREPTEIELAAATDLLFQYGFSIGWRDRRDPRSLSNNMLLEVLGFALMEKDAEASTGLLKIALLRKDLI